MRVVELVVLEDCFDGSLIREVRVDGELDEAALRRLSRGARLDFHPEFPRPYFRIERPHAWTLQGVLGSDRFRATFSPRLGLRGPALLTTELQGE